MEKTINKIAGWILLIAGALMIFWGVFASYDIFTGKKQAPMVFTSPAINGEIKTGDDSEKAADTGKIGIEKYKNIDLKNLQNTQQTQEDQMQNLVKESLGNQLEKIMPTDSITKIMNLSSWSMFVFILIYAGSKIASLGIKLVKG